MILIYDLVFVADDTLCCLLDSSAMELARRLDGLPLALATAGAYLRQVSDSFSDYLQLYDNNWDDLGQYSDGLLDYDGRTLYSTWNVSYQQIQRRDPSAAELLRLMAYLGNQDLWYELFQAGADAEPWWLEIVKSKARFNYAISMLHDYSLVEVQAGSYSLHACVHDWTLELLNRSFDDKLCRLAVRCIGRSVQLDTKAEYWIGNRRLLQHVQRLGHNRIKDSIDWSNLEITDLHRVAHLCRQFDMNSEAEAMYLQALQGYEKVLGAEHTSILDIVSNLGVLYKNQDKMAEAEAMYLRALQGNEKALGAEHTSTLNTVNNLGMLYANQGKMVEAEAMYLRALRGKEMVLGAEHTSTLETVNNLGVLYKNQGKVVEAEAMYLRTLQGDEKALGAEHTSTLGVVSNLGLLYGKQGRIVEAEAMCLRALQGNEKALGVEHTSTLRTVGNLGILYADQGKMAEAEAMFLRALQGKEKALGAGHTSTLNTVNNLGTLYKSQGKTAEAEAMYLRALQGYENAVGADHPRTRVIARNLNALQTSS
jgi:tetratricopeptide (TPR) repeat protein